MRFFAFCAFLCASCFWFSASSALAEQFDIITTTQISPGVVLVRIDKPNPKQPATEYPSITFMPGDVVTVDAGGCVQSGGFGNTWHRYVNPSGGKSDKYYKGLITIPFATGVLEPIKNYVGKTVTVATGAPAGAHLQLGFQDDDYSDNGYYAHDNGPNDQCKGASGGPAWVTLTISHGGATPAPVGGGPWDLVFNQFDANGVPLNPTWRSPDPDPASCTWPWNGSEEPQCTTQINDTDSHYTCQWFHSNYGMGGHANWMAGTYTGTVNWEAKSPAVMDDDDYSMDLTTTNGAGHTSGSPYGVHVEFDASETIDNLTDNFKLPWWKLFRTAADAGNTQTHALIDGHAAVVTGLVGVDFAHTPGAESHPAWGFALEANSNPSDDTWAIFARNWGNEGYCSGSQHYIDFVGQQYAMSLPWPSGAVSGMLTSNTQFFADGKTSPAVTVSFIPGQEVRITFSGMADPAAHQLIGGELHIAWTMSSARRRPPISSIFRPQQPPVAAPQRDATEAFLSSAVSRLSPAQRAVYLNALPHKTAPVRIKHHLSARTVALRGQTRSRRILLRPRIRSAPDPEHVALINAKVEALRKAYGGVIPGLPPRAVP